MSQTQPRLDAAETVFFKRQLEAIDARVYEHKYPQYKARMLIPTQQGVDEVSRVYTYRMFDQLGKAKFIGNAADDLPRAEASGQEFPQVIKNLGCAYGYDIFEIKAAAKTGTPLDDMRARGARRAMEEKIDEILAVGDADYGLKGLLTLDDTTSYSGSGAWGDLDAADPDKVAADLLGAASAGAEATDEAFNRFTIVLPLPKYNLAANLRMGDGSDVTVLKYVLATSPYLEAVVPWFRCEGVASGPADRLCAFPRDAEVVAALVPKELEFLPPEQRNLEYVINGVASCGGVVARYPKAITYMDGL